MRLLMTLIGLAVTLIATACDSKKNHGPSKEDFVLEGKPKSAPPEQSARTPPDLKCDVAPDPRAEETWLAQLPLVVQFKFKETKKEGVVAEPSCVRDRAHAPDYDRFVATGGIFPNSLKVTYARSVTQLGDQSRFAKLQRLELTQYGRAWSGKMNEIPKVDLVWDAMLDLVLPITRTIELPPCTEAEMAKPVEVPAPVKADCPRK